MIYGVNSRVKEERDYRTNQHCCCLISIKKKINNPAIFLEAEKKNQFIPEYILEHNSNEALFENWLQSGQQSFSKLIIFLIIKKIYFFNNSHLKYMKNLENLITQSFYESDYLKDTNILSREKQEDRSKKDDIIINGNSDQNFLNKEQIFNPVLSDLLANLPNQNFLLKCLEHSIELVNEGNGYIFAVLFLDLNRFQAINSSLGRKLGDRLLIAISQRLKTCLRSQDIIARLGNNEFGILLENIHNSEYATDVAERIYKQLLLSFEVEGYEVFIDTRIGIALGKKGYQRAEDILRDSELAASYAKRQSRTHYQVFNQSMHAHALSLLQLENDLRWAIEREEFELYYQPIVCLTTQQIKGFEALVRWHHPLRGFLSPSEFIPIAEENGLIVPLGLWVLRQACRQMYLWQSNFSGISDWKISVNISSKQLTQVNFVGQVKQILQETGLAPNNLKLEITESSLIEDTQITIAILKHLKALGVEFSLDDFGTGYSSLSYLHMFPFNTLKIDRSFVSSMEKSNEKLGIIRAIVTLAQNLSMDVISEGIETVAQLAQLKVLKCQYGQGYFFAKPLNSQGIETLIKTELTISDNLETENYRAILEEQISKEQLLIQIEHLRQEIAELKQEKVDLEIMLETTTEHADLVESQLQKEINDRQKIEADLQEVNQELERLTILDSLTQVANRRKFDDYLLQQWQKLRKAHAPLSLILCDVDYFKLYNDTYGHPIGDHCLQQIALAIESALDRESDLVARYGGEEFAVILPDTNTEKAMAIAEAIRLQVKKLKIAHGKSTVSEYVTMSLGVFTMIPTPEGAPELLISLADKALYEAKIQGRDRAVLAMS
jgi:diguanylate cyclase (GGDEF)-like protein